MPIPCYNLSVKKNQILRKVNSVSKTNRAFKVFALSTVLCLMLGSVALATTATVQQVDKYGNITLNILTEILLNEGFEFGDVLMIEIGTSEIEAPFVTAYSDVDNGSVLVRGPGGEGTSPAMLAVNMGNFAGAFKVQEGDQVKLSLLEKEGYLTEWTIRQLSRSNERADYASDEIFANFREVTLGNMAPGMYYRSSSPVNNDLNRAAYADEFMALAQIETVINLADSQQELDAYFRKDDYNSPYYKSLYEQGQVILLSMGVDFNSLDFQGKLHSGLLFMVENPGPYLVHCNEGKDRAGFVAALLEAFMGATATEIKEDYMLTYINYYGVEYGSEQYDKIAESNILASLRDIAGLPKGADLTDVDLVQASENYLQKIGLTKFQVEVLRTRLAQPMAPAA